ncbi:hypothetical protein Tco_0791680 [Tanacetum coccineum]
METQKPLLKDEDGKEVDVHMYRSMISSIMYLTSSRPDIMFAVCACARYEVNPKVSHLHAVKRIYSAEIERVVAKSITEACVFLVWTITFRKGKQRKVLDDGGKCCLNGLELMLGNLKVNAAMRLAILTDPHHTPIIIQSLTQPQKTQKPRKPKRKDTQVPHPSDPSEHVVDKAIHKKLGDSLVRAATTASSLEEKQDSESSVNEESLGEDASKQERIDAIDADEEITLYTESRVLGPKKKRVVIQELGESTTTISSQLSLQQSQDKGKGILIELVKPMNKKDLIRLNEETTLNLQAEFDEEERLARKKAEKKKKLILP